MGFGIEKCAMLVMKSRKQYITEEIKQPNQEKLEHTEKKKPTNTWGYWKLYQYEKHQIARSYMDSSFFN